MHFSNDFQTLLTLADAYSSLSYSVIPLLGDLDPSRPKVPAIPWAAFQTYRSTPRDHQTWFEHQKFAGLGIVTGRVSQLVVLDFDTEATFNAFKADYPDLLETHIVRSAGRQLPHLYFKLPPHLSLASQKGQGIDLLSDGRYVVAPPTTINGQPYKVSRGAMPKTLTERDIRRIQTFLNTHKLVTLPLEITLPTVLPPPAAPQLPRQPNTADLHALYHHLAVSRGRNEALFHTSLFARDQRLTLHQTQIALVSLHSQQIIRASHIKENARQREHEALKTIQSAFSRPPRALSPSLVYGGGLGRGLSNSVREILMQQGLTAVVRTYEGLLQSGMHPGQRFTADQAVKRLKGLVGRDSILNALKAGQGDMSFFTPVSPLNTANAIAHSHIQKLSKKCFLIVSKKQEKPQGGRPTRIYRLPTNKDLCRILAVKVTRSDAVERADLNTARQTRMALHRELLKRRPGSYPKRWLAARLGVSRRTIYNYNQLLSIHSRAMFLETPIGWKTITRLPLDEALQGAYLQTVRGKKYPALRQIASRLLARGEGLRLKQQTANYYWVGDIEPSPLVWTSAAQQQAEKQEVIETFIAHQPTVDYSSLSQPSQPVLPVPKPQKQPVSKLVSSPHDYKKALVNLTDEAFATQLYDALNQFGGSEFHKLSQASARWLTTTYDAKLLHTTLDTLKARAASQTIRNPVGFFITLVRSAARTAH